MRLLAHTYKINEKQSHLKPNYFSNEWILKENVHGFNLTENSQKKTKIITRVNWRKHCKAVSRKCRKKYEYIHKIRIKLIPT